MRKSRIKAKLSRNEPVVVTTLHLMDPSVYELASLMGFDGIWMDMEHHSYSLETAAVMMRAARTGVSDIVARPAKGEFMRMQRMLEAGAQGIMYPRCDDAEEAREVVRWAKFAPQGKRGFDGGNPDMPYLMMSMPQYVEEANRETFLALQIEQPETIEHIEAIAAVDGVDILMVGPGDLSIQLGIPGQVQDPIIQDIKKRVAAACKKYGKHWGCPSGSPADVKMLLDMGARWICYGADILMVKIGLDQIRQGLAPLGVTFDSSTK